MNNFLSKEELDALASCVDVAFIGTLRSYDTEYTALSQQAVRMVGVPRWDVVDGKLKRLTDPETDAGGA